MPWSQIYVPLGSLGLSALVAALPVVVLLGLLGFWRARTVGARRQQSRRIRKMGIY